MRLILAAAAVLVLGGCGFTPQGDFLRSAVADRGRGAAAAGLENAEWFLCRVALIGAVRDRYGSPPERMAAYNTLCSAPSAPVNLTPPSIVGALRLQPLISEH